MPERLGLPEGGGLSPTLDSLLESLNETPLPRRWLLCRACDQRITPDAARIPVGQQHEHTFTNPHGFVFHIGCFDDAPGVLEEGQPESRWSWFSGYAWQIVICQQCRWQLGWYFSNGNGFYGLILDRLHAEPSLGPQR